MKPLLKPVLALLLLAAIGFGTFFAVHTLREKAGGDSGAVAETPPPGEVQAAQLEAIFAADAAKPRFNGELLGIYIAPSDAAVPQQYKSFIPECGPAGAPAAWEQAGQFDLSVQLPPEFVYLPDHYNTGVVAWACNGQVYSAGWAYQFRDDPGSMLVVSRSVLSYMTPNAAVDHVKAISAGGRQAVLIEPVRPEGTAQLSPAGTYGAVVFPESFGSTIVCSSGVPLADLLRVAEIVGQATK